MPVWKYIASTSWFLVATTLCHINGIRCQCQISSLNLPPPEPLIDILYVTTTPSDLSSISTNFTITTLCESLQWYISLPTNDVHSNSVEGLDQKRLLKNYSITTETHRELSSVNEAYTYTLNITIMAEICTAGMLSWSQAIIYYSESTGFDAVFSGPALLLLDKDSCYISVSTPAPTPTIFSAIDNRFLNATSESCPPCSVFCDAAIGLLVLFLLLIGIILAILICKSCTYAQNGLTERRGQRRTGIAVGSSQGNNGATTATPQGLLPGASSANTGVG